MNEHWYWETKAELYGPLATSDVEGLIVAQKIKASDRLKLGEKGEWLSGTEVMELVGSPSSLHSNRSASRSADDVLHDMHRRQVQRAMAGSDSQTSVSDSMKSVSRAMENLRDGLINGLAAGVGFFLTTRGKYAILAACGIITLCAIGGRMDVGSTPAGEMYLVVSTMVERCSELQQSKASVQEWQAFSTSATPVLTSIQEEIEESMKNNDLVDGFVFHTSALDSEIKKGLYQIVKYDLPDAFAFSQSNNTEINYVTSAQLRLANVTAMVARLEDTSSWSVNWTVVGMKIGLPKLWLLKKPKAKPATPSESDWSLAMTGMILADIGIVAWLLWAFRKSLMFWKRKPVRT